MSRRLLILLSPITLPLYLLAQAGVFVVGACYYVVLASGVERIVRRPIALGQTASILLTPLVVAVTPVVLTVQIALWLIVVALRGLAAAGRWQAGLRSPVASSLAGLIWVGLFGWTLIASLSPPTGWAILGRDVPGLTEHIRATRYDLSLGEMSADVQARRGAVADRLRAQAKVDGYTSVWADSMADDAVRYLDLSPELRRQLVGVPFYYTLPAWADQGHGLSQPLWGAMCAGLLLLVWRLRSWGDRSRAAAMGSYLIRVAAVAAMMARVFAGQSPQANVWAARAAEVLLLAAVLVVVYRLGARLLGSAQLGRYYGAFIASRLLQRRRIAFFSVGAVTLCVAMVLIVVSVMGGFLEMIRMRSRGLLGDLIMERAHQSLEGFPQYQGFIDTIVDWPEVEAATPVVYTYGVMRVRPTRRTSAVRVVGIRLDETVRVNTFGQGLFYEQWYPGTTSLGLQRQPIWGWKDGLAILPADLEAAQAKSEATGPEDAYVRLPDRPFPGPGVYASGEMGPTGTKLSEVAWDLLTTMENVHDLRGSVEQANEGEAKALADRQRELADALATTIATMSEIDELSTLAADVARAKGVLLTATDQLANGAPDQAAQLQMVALTELTTVMNALRDQISTPRYEGRPLPGAVIGVDLIANRMPTGGYYRSDTLPRGSLIDLTIVPLTPKGQMDIQGPRRQTFRYMDDSHTGVHEIDALCVYVEFERLQALMKMDAQPLTEEAGGGMAPARCSQVQIKLATGVNPLDMQKRIASAWRDHTARVGADSDDRFYMSDVNVYTWEEMQAVLLAAVEKEKALVTTLFGVISLVAVFLVLCIFYMIVQEKTRDIGIIKSIGGSSAGVAGIFLGYGAAIGAVGAVLGVTLGGLFVRYINEIQDWLASVHPGLRIWSAEVYVFDRIPITVAPNEVATIVIVAILAATLGAAVPAWRAARTWPAEALRHE